MSRFEDGQFCDLTVGEAQELNEAARWLCEYEATSEVGDDSAN